MLIATISAMGNWIGDTILYPIDTISTRLKASKYIHHNPITFTIASIRNDKFKLYRGVHLTFPCAFIPTFLYVSIYDSGINLVTSLLHKYNLKDEYKLLFPFFISAMAQCLCLFQYLPVDTVRTRIQVFYLICRWTIQNMGTSLYIAA